MSKKIPAGIMHESAVMAWAKTTPLSEHKEREKAGVKIDIIPSDKKKIEPLPLSRATTELRRAYPYIFDCAAYVKTHSPEKIETDTFYSRFTMPYNIFLDYCLDACVEQTQYLKEEIYALMKGQPAKYIKVSKTGTVFAQPVIIAFHHTDLKTGKDERIKNIGKDKKVNLVQVQIIKELLDISHGYLNMPKAPYAKIRRVFNVLKELIKILSEGTYREQINKAKTFIPVPVSTPVATRAAIKLLNFLQEQKEFIGELDQGGYYAIYMAFEYILVNKKRGVKQQDYNFLDLCEKCYPRIVQHRDGKCYFDRGNKSLAFLVTLQMTVILCNESAFNISQIEAFGKDLDCITVFFY
jgi:hypothetical protein